MMTDKGNRRPILAATDGSTAGESAIRAAAALAPLLNAEVRLIIVVEPLPVLVPEPSVITQPLVVSPELMNGARERAVLQLRDVVPEGVNWHVDVEYGRPSAEIAEKAQEWDARLIVMGLVHHGIVDRMLDGDTALELVRQSATPVLLAATDWKLKPVTALFAVDFSPQSMHAARVGMALLDRPAKIVLAHVRPTAAVFDGAGIWEDEYEKAAEKELLKFEAALDCPEGISTERVILRGSPSSALLNCGDEINADLIVAGTRGAGFMQRLLLGSVATRLVRHTNRSLLIAPDEKE